MLAVGNILMRGSGTRMWSRWIYTFWVNVSCFLGNPCRIWSGRARKKKNCNSLLLFNWLSIMDICKHHDYKIQNKESICRCVCVCVCAQSQSCLTLCYPMDYNPSYSSTHLIFKARILERVAIFSSRGSSQPSEWTVSPALQAEFLPLSHWRSPIHR